MAGMKNLLGKLKLALTVWLRQPKDEMDKRQTQSDIQALLPKNPNSN